MSKPLRLTLSTVKCLREQSGDVGVAGEVKKRLRVES